MVKPQQVAAAVPSVELKGVKKCYGSLTVVPNLDLTVYEGEFVVLLGGSGCGKSTTLRMIAGLEDVTEGSVSIAGMEVTDAPPKDRNVAMVFQDYALYPSMTVAGNMSFSLRLQGQSKASIRDKVARAASILDIEDYLNRRPKELSGGQRQRVAIGRAIVREPGIFLFDEPLSNLDAKLRSHMRTELALLHERLGKTTIYVTHDQVEAMTLASRIVIMDKGVIQQDGTPEEVFDRPENLFVATFIGSPNMNILTASAADKAGVKVLTGEGFELPVPNALADSVIHIGKDYKVGVRPHLLEPVDDAEADLAIDVKVVENLGTESVLVGRLIGNERTEISVLRPGVRTDLAHKRVHLKIPPDAIHVFDMDTGLALR